MKFPKIDLKDIEEWKKNNPSVEEEEETKPVSEQESGSSDLGDLLKGAAQGATLGFGDEILAALQATVSPDQKSWLESYRQKQKENEAAYQEAKERSPWLTGLGELGGGFLMPVGGAVKAAKALGAVTPVAKAATTGAIIGGAAGLGASEGAIEETPGKLASDALSGAVFGGAFGGATGYAGQQASKYIEESPKIQRAIRAMGLESKGVNLTTEQGQSTVNKTVNDATKESADSLVNAFKAVSEDLNDTIAKYADKTPNSLFENLSQNPNSSGAKVKSILANNSSLAENFGLLRDYQKAAQDPMLMKFKMNRITGQLEDAGLLDVSDLLNIKKEIKGNLRNILKTSPSKFQNRQELAEIQELPDLIDDILKNHAPDIAEAYKVKAQMAYPIEVFLNDSVDPSTHGTTIKRVTLGETGYKKLQQKLQDAINKKIYDTSGTGSRVVENKNFLKEFTEEYNKRLSESLPKSTKLELQLQDKNIISPDEMLGKIENAYKDLGAMEATEGMKRSAEDIKGVKEAAEVLSSGATGLPIGLGSEGFTNIAGKLGRIEYNLGKPVTKTRDLIKTYGVDKLKSLAQTMRNSNLPVAKKLGESAMTSLENGDAASRAAFINSIMQHPDLRKMLDLGLDKEE